MSVPLRANLACVYASRGWKVFPCEPGGKRPHRTLAPRGFKDATADLDQIQEWWNSDPTANIGIATGAVSGLLVIDVDLRHSGPKSWAGLAGASHIETATVRTPGGGYHLYFRMPTGIGVRSSVQRFAPGIDVRGDGGYVVAAGSSTGQGEYVWDPDTTLADPPDWLQERLSAARPDRTDHGRAGAGPIKEGQRNVSLTSLAGSMRRKGASVACIEAALAIENRCRCAPPLDDREVCRIAQSVGQYPAAAGQTGTPSRMLRFRTAADLAREAPAAPEFMIHGLAAIGCVTEITGAPKRSGKTTFAAFAVQAVLAGLPFLGTKTRRSPVVWLTEEGPETFVEALRAAGILGREDLHVLSWFDVGATPWPEVMKQATAKCLGTGAKLLLVDTLPQFASLRGDTENNAGDALMAVGPLRVAAQAGLAVVANRHDRKAGGDVGDSGRGSSAFAGAFDILISLRRPDGGARPTIRLLQGLSRFRQTPDRLVIELTDSGYVSHGTESRIALEEAKAAVRDGLPGPPGLTMDEICDALPKGKRTVIQSAISELGTQIGRSGRGKRGDPVRYFRQLVSADAKGLSGGRNQLGGHE